MSDAALIDIPALCAPLGDAAPCGENLEYDPLFLQMEEAARGKPEVQYGDTITAATPPDWQAVMDIASQLMQRSRDLRTAVLLARALLNLHGVAGLAAGLDLLAELLALRWDTLHPQLDPDDGNDPLLRVNVLAALCEPAAMLRELRDTPLVSARALGRFSLRDIDAAANSVNATTEEPAAQQVTLSVIEAAFAAADQQALAATGAALDAAGRSSARIEQLLTEQVGVARALNLGPLTSLLNSAAAVVCSHLRGEAAAPPADAAAPAAPQSGLPVPQRDMVANREDVTRMLDKLCAYYAAHEPSSPVPLLLQRARRLVDKSFTELLQDLAPDGLAQLAQVSGVRTDS